MPTDYSLEVRQSIVAHLAGYAPLTSLVSAARIYGEEPPTDPVWPFIRYGLDLNGPFEATGWDGSKHDVTIHAFARGPYADAGQKIAKQVVEAMKTWSGPSGTGIVTAEWQDTIPLRDSPPEEKSRYHFVIRFAVAVAG